MMVSHSLGRKPNVLFMLSFELKCFSLFYINIYILLLQTQWLILSGHCKNKFPTIVKKGTTMQQTSVAGRDACFQVQRNRRGPNPLPIPVAALETSQRSKQLYKCLHQGALQEMPAQITCNLLPLPTLRHHWIHQGVKYCQEDQELLLLLRPKSWFSVN